MISVEAEQAVRTLVAQGLPHAEVSRRTGVSRGTIRAISKLKRLRDRRVPSKDTGRTRRARCPECGKLVNRLPCLLCHPESGSYEATEMAEDPCTLVSPDAIRRNLVEMLKIIRDVTSLHALGLVDHPLFSDIAKRATTVLNTYNIQVETFDDENEPEDQEDPGSDGDRIHEDDDFQKFPK